MASAALKIDTTAGDGHLSAPPVPGDPRVSVVHVTDPYRALVLHRALVWGPSPSVYDAAGERATFGRGLASWLAKEVPGCEPLANGRPLLFREDTYAGDRVDGGAAPWLPVLGLVTRGPRDGSDPFRTVGLVGAAVVRGGDGAPVVVVVRAEGEAHDEGAVRAALALAMDHAALRGAGTEGVTSC